MKSLRNHPGGPKCVLAVRVFLTLRSQDPVKMKIKTFMLIFMTNVIFLVLEA